MDEAISLNALSGTEVPNIIKLREKSKRNTMTIFIDSRSMHNFLYLETAGKMGCLIKKVAPMRVTVANGNHLISLHTCPYFNWSIQGMVFEIQ